MDFADDEELAAAIQAYRVYIMGEIMAVSCQGASELSSGTELDLNGHTCRVRVARA